MNEQLKQNKSTWNFTRLQLVVLILAAFLFGSQTTILVLQPGSESLIGAGFGAVASLLIIFNALYSAKKANKASVSR